MFVEETESLRVSLDDAIIVLRILTQANRRAQTSASMEELQSVMNKTIKRSFFARQPAKTNQSLSTADEKEKKFSQLKWKQRASDNR